MIRVQNLALLQENIMDLVEYAHQHDAVHLNGEHDLEIVAQFIEVFKRGVHNPLTRKELEALVRGVQECVKLPVYTTTQAAAWLGVGIDRIRDAVWKSDPPELKTMKPGHDILVPHEELVRFLENGKEGTK